MIMSNNEVNRGKIKELKDLNLMDRFLFAEAIEDKEFYEALLTIILGEDITLKGNPIAEKEMRSKLQSKYVRFDVWAEDTQDRIHNTEVQKENKFKNLPRRNRYYIGIIDVNQHKPGTLDYNSLKDIVMITITSFDPFGEGLYKYTVTASCEECQDMKFDDGITRIFLNTEGTNPAGVSPELISLLKYFKNTNDENASKSNSDLIKLMHRKIEKIRENDKMGVRYMNAWEERILDRQEGMEEGHAKGLEEGMEQGIVKGRSEGLEEGVNKGKKQQQLEVALKLKADNLTIEKIAEYTGLSPEEIETL